MRKLSRYSFVATSLLVFWSTCLGQQPVNPDDTNPAAAYRRKWKAMLSRPDFETAIPEIRVEIDTILKSKIKREDALLAAAYGYELIADEEGQFRIEALVLSELPESDWARRLERSRVFLEKDARKQEAMLESFIARFPSDPNISQLLGALFRIKARRSNPPDSKIASIGEAWIGSLKGSSHDMIRASELVCAVLAERQIELGRAQKLADEAIRLANDLTNNASNEAGKLAVNVSLLKEMANTARGLVYLRQGRLEEAAKALTDAFRPVINEVERNGVVLWKDSYLSEVGVSSRVIWLARLYEAQGDNERAARYWLAGSTDWAKTGDHEVPAVFKKLGYRDEQVEAAIRAIQSRYASLTSKTAGAKEEERKRLLADRINLPAPDFKVVMLDKKELQFADLKGKVIVLNFWATWCGPCVAELQHFQKLFEKYKANPEVALLAVSVDEIRPAVRPFIQKNNYTFTSAYDGGAANGFGVRGVPLTIIIDRNGIIQFREQGFGGDGADYIERMSWRIDELLRNSPATSTTETTKER